MNAMILAAGYGTRLRPLTYLLPKPVFPVANRPMIAYAVESLLATGVDEIVVNLHHLPEPIETLLTTTFDCTFHFSREPVILGTGGGVKKVREFLERDAEFLLVNGDTIQFPRYAALIEARRAANAVAALSLRHPPPGDRFTPVFADNGRITGFGEGGGEALMFSGAHAVSRAIFDEMPATDGEFGMVDSVYAALAARGALAAVVDDGVWFDVGTPRRYLAANAGLRNGPALVDDNATVSGAIDGSVIGAGSRIDGAVIDSVVWRRCRIGPDVRLRECIVGDDVVIDGDVTIESAIICRDDPAIPHDGAYQRRSGLVIAPF